MMPMTTRAVSWAPFQANILYHIVVGCRIVHHSKNCPLMSQMGQKHRIDVPDEFAACPLWLR
jgi:hypothetical protein